MNTEKKTPQVVESYRDYSPSFPAASVVEMLLGYVPSRFLNSLGQIVLRNAAGLNRQRRRQRTLSRKKRVKLNTALGCYHQERNGIPASIDLFVDKIEEFQSSFPLNISFTRNLATAWTLYHEIGHHIHSTTHREHREREDVADEWGRKLTVYFVRKRYWYAWPLIFLLSKSIDLWVRLFRKK
jgi:hypothetical protein